MACLVVGAVAPAGRALGTPIASHSYQLNGNFDDSLGGPALVGGGGALAPTGYAFLQGQGLSLSNGVDTANYSIEMYFFINETASWRKLIDFDDRTADAGLYNFSTSLYLYPVTSGPANAFLTRRLAHVVLTRDNATRQVTGYVDGVMQLTAADDNKVAVFDAPQRIARFFVDDTQTLGENASGFVDFIRIYDFPLSAGDVAALYAAIPEPSTFVLAGMGLAGLAVWRCRAKRTRTVRTLKRPECVGAFLRDFLLASGGRRA